MKKPWILAVAVVLVLGAVLALRAGRAFSADMQRASGTGASLYDLEVRTLEGEPADLGRYRGMVALVVNTASKCGLTPQYEGLEALYRDLGPQGFVILGFPSNDFMGQEPGSPEEIRLFCTDRYDVTFPLFEKTHVKGDDKSAVYRVLTAELDEPSWNFTKYVVDRQGRVVARFGPRTAPDSPRLRDTIERALAAGG
jgi:glutathione peroxidase